LKLISVERFNTPKEKTVLQYTTKPSEQS